MSDQQGVGVSTRMPDIDPPADIGGALVRGALGLIPGVGSIVTELVNEIVPDQRHERVRDYLVRLDQRLAAIEEADLRRRVREPENVDLFEEGAFQSARALSHERKAYIANLVASGITGGEAERLQAKRLLRLLREVDDRQIIILVSKLRRHRMDEEFRERHEAVLKPRPVSIGVGREALDEAALHEDARSHLVRLGLLAPKFRRPHGKELPEFDDKTGMMKATSVDLTQLGRLLLRQIGLAGPDEF